MRMLMLIEMVMLMLMAGGAWAYDPPEILAELRGYEFCWVGDQNGDGCDDIMAPFINGYAFYFGGANMDTVPDFVIRPADPTRESMVGEFGYYGKLSDNSDHWFVIKSIYRNDDSVVVERVYFFKGYPELDTIPDLMMTQHRNSFYRLLGSPENRRPADFNGDGYNDVLLAHSIDWDITLSQLLILNGGSDFDTIPECQWEAPVVLNRLLECYSGCDINGDGYDDALLGMQVVGIQLYLGGAVIDTIPIFTLPYRAFAPRSLRSDFAMLHDVNGDGYDDWGAYWVQPDQGVGSDGYYVFNGSAHPDTIPDIELAGSTNLWNWAGKISGGDFNGDGIGDIVTINPMGFAQEGEIHIHFGQRQLRSEPDVVVNIRHQYNARFLFGTLVGAVGDYNGDGLEDFAANNQPAGYPSTLYVLVSPEDWRVSVPTEPPIQVTEWEISAYPNPFNGSIKFDLSFEGKGGYKAEIFDVNGRKVGSLFEGKLGAGSHSFDWKAPAAGVYLVTLSSDRGRLQTLKIVAMP